MKLKYLTEFDSLKEGEETGVIEERKDLPGIHLNKGTYFLCKFIETSAKFEHGGWRKGWRW